MALDGVFIRKLTAELQQAIGAHIDKIHQPSADELVLLLRSPGFAKRLLISAKSGLQRVHFTETRFDNPPTPPMFCMLMRKYLGAGRILSITAPDFERLIEIKFSSLNEMGDVITPRLIIELISSCPNIILVGENGKIITALKKSDIESGGRLIQPGAIYEYPEKQNKILPIKENIEAIKQKANPLSEKELLSTVAGFSPLICREIADGYASLESVIEKIENENTAYIIKNAENIPTEFSYTDIKQYGNFTSTPCSSFSSCLEEYFLLRSQNAVLKQYSQDIEKILNNLKARIEKRMNLRKMDLKKCEKKEELRIFGELLKANLYKITKGATFVTVENFYDENLKEIKIPLKSELSPQANAARYFKEYKKAHTAEGTLTLLIESDEQELKYIESVIFALSEAKSVQDIEELREELILSGYLRAKPQKSNKKTVNKFNETVSPSGYRVLIGKNNRQNDIITCSLASKNDMWFHTKNIPGSHVVVFSGGNDLSNEDILFAAGLAAQNSKAHSSAQVPVDYTPIKFVKKPNGTKPGMVIYTTNSTVFVTPSEVFNDKNN